MSIKALPLEARPREKLLARGPSALSDAELLALLLRTGIAGKGVLQMADELLQIKGQRTVDGPTPGFGGIAGLLAATPEDLKKVKGLGPAKRAEILAVLELAKRAVSQRLQERAVMEDPASVKQHIQMLLAQRPHEVFAVCFLDARNHLLHTEELFRGTLSQTSV